MKSKQYPSEVYVLRKRVNLSSESSQLIWLFFNLVEKDMF